MRKAITPVISIVLLTLMTVGAAVLGYFWINSVQASMQESAGMSISDAPGGENTRLQIISVRGDGITIQNVGSSDLINVTVLINGELTSYDLENPLSPGDAVLIPFSEPLDSDNDYTFTIATSTGTKTSANVDKEEATTDAGYGNESSANSIEVFMDGSSSKTVSFTQPSSQMVNISIPNTATITSATMDVEGLSSWSEIINVSSNIGFSLFPRAVIDSSENIHFVWSDDFFAPGINNEIFYKNFTNGVWSVPENISQNKGNPVYPDASNPIAVFDSSGNLHVMWDDNTPGNFEIFYKNRTNGVWSDVVNVSGTADYSDEPYFVFDNLDNLHVVWYEDKDPPREVFYKNRTNGVWSELVNLSGDGAGPFGTVNGRPKIIVDSSNVLHFVWSAYYVDTSQNQIFYKNCTNGVWSDPFNISSNSASSLYPDIVLDSSENLHVVWEDASVSNGEVFYKNRTISGWSEVVNISRDNGKSWVPKIRFDSSDKAHFVWYGDTENPVAQNIYYTNRTSGVFSEVLNISESGLESYDPMMYFDSADNLHFTWIDTDMATVAEVMYKYKSYSRSPTIKAGNYGSNDWTYANYLTTTSSMPDFTSKLNTLLSTCDCPSCYDNSTHCLIGLNISSLTAGGIIFSDLNILYE